MKTFVSEMGLIENNWRTFTKTTPMDAGTSVSMSPDPIIAQTLTRIGNIVTFTAAAPHKLVNGQFVRISGADQAEYNGKVQIAVTSATEFEYVITQGAPVTPATGDITATFKAHARRALVRADKTNSDDVSIGPDPDADFDEIPAGQSYLIQNPRDAKFDLANWHIKSTGVSQVVKIAFVSIAFCFSAAVLPAQIQLKTTAYSSGLLLQRTAADTRSYLGLAPGGAGAEELVKPFDPDQFSWDDGTTHIKDGVSLLNPNVEGTLTSQGNFLGFGKFRIGAADLPHAGDYQIYLLDPGQDVTTLELGSIVGDNAYGQVILSANSEEKWAFRPMPVNEGAHFEVNKVGAGGAFRLDYDTFAMSVGGSYEAQGTLHSRAVDSRSTLFLEGRPTTAERPNFSAFQNSFITLDGTASIAQQIPVDGEPIGAWFIEARIAARRTGGTAGTDEDAASYIRRALFVFKSGTLTIVGSVQDGFTAEDQSGWNADLIVDGNLPTLQVTGATDNHIAWHATTFVQKVQE